MTLNEFKELFSGKSYSYFPYKVRSKIDDVLKNEKVLNIIGKQMDDSERKLGRKDKLRTCITDWLNCDSLLLNLYGGSYFINYTNNTNAGNSIGNPDICIFVTYKDYLESKVNDKDYPTAKIAYDSNEIRWVCEVSIFGKFFTLLDHHGIAIAWNVLYLDAVGHIRDISDISDNNRKERIFNLFIDGMEIDRSEIEKPYKPNNTLYPIMYLGDLHIFELNPNSSIPKSCMGNSLYDEDFKLSATQAVIGALNLLTTLHEDVKWY